MGSPSIAFVTLALDARVQGYGTRAVLVTLGPRVTPEDDSQKKLIRLDHALKQKPRRFPGGGIVISGRNKNGPHFAVGAVTGDLQPQ